MIESSRSENVEIFFSDHQLIYCMIYFFKLCDDIVCYLLLENKIKFIFTLTCHVY